MPFGQYNLTRIQSLQTALQPLATRLLDLAREQGVELEVTQAYRSPEAQQALYTSGTGVTKAPALLSFHNYGLAFDVVPKDYLNLPNWNPGGPLWARIGQIGESLGLQWGGRWSTPDYPHFELHAAPIQELKAYWEKFKTIMPVTLIPGTTALAVGILAGVAWWFFLRPTLQDKGLL